MTDFRSANVETSRGAATMCSPSSAAKDDVNLLASPPGNRQELNLTFTIGLQGPVSRDGTRNMMNFHGVTASVNCLASEYQREYLGAGRNDEVTYVSNNAHGHGVRGVFGAGFSEELPSLIVRQTSPLDQD